jgi:WD40 repeat protein/phage FluMu protein Com
MSIQLTCDQCGKRLKASEQFVGRKVKCPQCGHILPVVDPDAAPAKAPAPPADTGSMELRAPAGEQCPECHAPKPSGAVICTSCGHNYQTGASASAPPLPGAAPTRKREGSGDSTKIIVLGGLVFAAIVVAAAVFIFGGSGGQSSTPPVSTPRPVFVPPTPTIDPNPDTPPPDRLPPQQDPGIQLVGPQGDVTVDPAAPLPQQFADAPGRYEMNLELTWRDAAGANGATRLPLPTVLIAAYGEGRWQVDVANRRWVSAADQLGQLRMELPLTAVAGDALGRLPFADHLDPEAVATITYAPGRGFEATVGDLGPGPQPPQVQTHTRRLDDPNPPQIQIPADAKVTHEQRLENGQVVEIVTKVTVLGQGGLTGTRLAVSKVAAPQPSVVREGLATDEVMRLRGHRAPLRCVDITPDGKRAVTADEQGYVVVWELTGHAAPRSLALPLAQAGPMYVRWADNEQLVVAGGRGKHLAMQVIDAASGNVLRQLDVTALVHADETDDAVWPADQAQFTGLWTSADRSTVLATGTSDSRWTAVWEVASGKLLGAAGGSERIALSPEGRTVWMDQAIARTGPGMSTIVQTKDLFHRSQPGRMRLPALSNDGHMVAIGNNQAIDLYDVGLRANIGTISEVGGEVRQLVFGDDSNRLLSTTANGTIGIWHLARRESLGELRWAEAGSPAPRPAPRQARGLAIDAEPFTDTVGMTAASADVSRIVCADAAGVVHVFAVANMTARERALPTITEAPKAIVDEATLLAESPDGRHLVVDVSNVKEIQNARREAAEEARRREERRRGAQRDGRRQPARTVVVSDTHLRQRGATQSLLEYDDPEATNTSRFQMASFGPGGLLVMASPTGLYTYRQTGSRAMARTGGTVRAGDLKSLQVTPNGQHVLVVLRQGNHVHQIDARSLRQLRQLPASTQPPVVSPNGALAALTVAEDGQRNADRVTNITLIDLGSGEAVISMQPMEQMVFTPDSRYLAGVQREGQDTEVVLMDVATGAVVRRFGIRDGQVTMPAFSPDGTVLATWATGGDGNARQRRNRLLLWDVPSGRRLVAAPFAKDRPTAIRFGIEGRRVLVTFSQSGSTIVGWASTADMRGNPIDRPEQTASAALVKLAEITRPARSVSTAAAAPDEELRMAVADRMGSSTWIRICDMRSGEVIRPLNAGRSEVTGLAFAPETGDLASCGDDAMVRAWPSDAMAVKWQKRMDTTRLGAPQTLAFNHDGSLLAVGGAGGTQPVVALNAEDGEPVRWLGDAEIGSVNHVAFTMDGRQLLAVAGGKLTVWNTSDWSQASQQTQPRAIWAIGADGRHILIAGDELNPATVLERTSGEVICRIDAPLATGGVLDPARQLVMLIDEPSGAIGVYDMTNGRRLEEVMVSSAGVATALAVLSPSDKRLVTVPAAGGKNRGDEPLRVWRMGGVELAEAQPAETGTRGAMLEPGMYFVTWFDYSPDQDTATDPTEPDQATGQPTDDAESQAAGKLRLVKLLLSAGKKDEARLACEKIVQECPGTKSAEEAAKLRDELIAEALDEQPAN